MSETVKRRVFKCGLCGEELTLNLDWEHPGEADHVPVPVEAGHEIVNVEPVVESSGSADGTA